MKQSLKGKKNKYRVWGPPQYKTNGIENLNKQIRKATKNKLSFEKEDRLIDYVFIVIKDFEEMNWQKYPVHLFKSWGKVS